MIRPERLGGLDLDAQWLDDFHHSLRTLLTGEDTGYYTDFGTLGHFARACQHGFVYAGEYSRYRNRRHGAPAPDVLPRQFVVYAQNHDQIGNRMEGDRLTEVVTAAQLRLAAAAVLLSPFTPMLFMGEEYGSSKPFPFFTDFGDPELVEAVREGRRAEFASFSWKGEPPDPQSGETFGRAVLDWEARAHDNHRDLLALYAQLMEIRRTEPGIHAADAINSEVLDTHGRPVDGDGTHGMVVIRRRAAEQSSILLLNFAPESARFDLPTTGQSWRCALDTAAPQPPGSNRRHGVGPHKGSESGAAARIEMAPHSAVLLLHDEV